MVGIGRLGRGLGVTAGSTVVSLLLGGRLGEECWEWTFGYGRREVKKWADGWDWVDGWE